jgi:protein-disulfide isomerase
VYNHPAQMAKDSPDQTIKYLLYVIAAGLIFAAGRWTADGGRFSELEAEQQKLRDQVAAMGGRGAGPAAPSPLTPPAPAPPILKSDIDLVIAGRPTDGAAAAPVVLIEFSDFQCPFCGRHVRETLPKLKAEYIDAGRVRHVFRHNPIPELHPEAPGSARAADCAHQQGKFWPMHARLFANPKDHSPAALEAHAQAVSLNMSAYRACMTGPARPLLQEDVDAGREGGVAGTPAFFIGRVQPDGRVRVTATVYGAKPFADFKAALDAALGEGQQ